MTHAHSMQYATEYSKLPLRLLPEWDPSGSRGWFAPKTPARVTLLTGNSHSPTSFSSAHSSPQPGGKRPPHEPASTAVVKTWAWALASFKFTSLAAGMCSEESLTSRTAARLRFTSGLPQAPPLTASPQAIFLTHTHTPHRQQAVLKQYSLAYRQRELRPHRERCVPTDLRGAARSLSTGDLAAGAAGGQPQPGAPGTSVRTGRAARRRPWPGRAAGARHLAASPGRDEGPTAAPRIKTNKPTPNQF